MSALRRLLLCGGLASIAALALAAPAPASAVKLVCDVEVFAKVVDKDDPTFGFRLVGGKGHFFATGTFTCAGTEKGAPTAVVLTVESDGVFESIVCGTFKGQSTDLDIVSASGGALAKYEALLEDETYAFEVVGGVENFYWHDTDKDTPGLKAMPGDPDKDGVEDGNWEFAGTLVPFFGLNDKQSSPGPAGNCTKAGRARGVVTIDES